MAKRNEIQAIAIHHSTRHAPLSPGDATSDRTAAAGAVMSAGPNRLHAMYPNAADMTTSGNVICRAPKRTPASDSARIHSVSMKAPAR